MKTLNVQFDYLSGVFTNSVIFREPLLIKGATTVNFCFTGVNEQDYKVDTLNISWGDGSPIEKFKRDLFFNYKTQSIFNEVLYGRLGGSILNTYAHNFYNETILYGVEYTAKILLNKNNASFMYIIQPITVYWNSYYDDVKKVSLLNSQVIPLSSNYTFINIETEYDRVTIPSILNTVGRSLLQPNTTVIPLCTYGITDIEEFIYLSEQDSTPINTVNPEDNIIVVPGYGDIAEPIYIPPPDLEITLTATSGEPFTETTTTQNRNITHTINTITDFRISWNASESSIVDVITVPSGTGLPAIGYKDISLGISKSYIVRATKNNLITERTINIIFAS
jgi:hypothetical protein